MRIFHSGIGTYPYDVYRDIMRNVMAVPTAWRKDRMRFIRKDRLDGKVTLFLDSGAFSLRKKASAFNWSFYDTPEFYEYVEKYVKLIRRHRHSIDWYANIDVIGNSDLTWRNQKMLEEDYGLKPVPVIHWSGSVGMEDLDRYLDAGYSMICLGGLVTRGSKRPTLDWVSKCFDRVLVDGIPTVKFHGFGVSSNKLLTGFPWWSVDSTTWIKCGAMGFIFIPCSSVNGGFDFSRGPFRLNVSDEIKDHSAVHFYELDHERKKWVEAWFSSMGLSSRKMKTEQPERLRAMVQYFNALEDSLGDWPRSHCGSWIPKGLSVF